MTLGEKRQIFTRLLAMFILSLRDDGYECTLNEVLRTKEQQELNVKNGVSKTMNSSHLTGCAADINLFKDGILIDGTKPEHAEHLRHAGEMWETMCHSNGLLSDWGGRFGVSLSEYTTKIGWDANHMGIKV
jgi:hypothetical protein